MSRERLVKAVKQFVEVRYKVFSNRYGQNIIDILDFPIKVVLSPFTLAFDIAGSAPRGFGVPELISKLSAASVFAIATLGTYDIALELGRKVICQRNCKTCNGWQALRCTMCRGSGKVHYQVKNCTLKSGEKATAESVADAIADNRAELVHLPLALDFQRPLPSKECPTCDGTIMEPPWQAYNVLKKMDYPYEHIAHSMKDPSIAAFWLITFPQIMGGFTYDDEVKQKIWWQYKESRRYDELRDEVAKRKPGWEYLQDALISIDPARARDDPVIVKNVPYYKAKKALETEVMKLDPPPRPPNWGELDLPLSASSWSEEDLKNPEKFYEMTVLLNAQREISDQILDAQWETKWRQDKFNEMLEAKVKPYIQDIDNTILSEPIFLKSQNQDQRRRRRRWFFF
ncbi:uncharacterized protein LOC113854328 isoform X2 [Abrus precatorius]|uniref:Uncharacterized protein LOC113854328 isoform X2 n=1 Tax=Abrus precatorius TaxID=3816 RepID=A0A8B8KBG1_ABRPR|nr:uncharacterized protein LOC113854328 isoform X2 [Abrus precatorius]